MAWIKIDDQFFRHPKVIEAGRDARDLYLAGLCFSGGALTDGFIPAQTIRRLAAEAELECDPMPCVERLLAVGLWEQTDRGYQVHDYLEYNPSAEQVKEDRAAARERMNKRRTGDVRTNAPSIKEQRSEEVRANNERSSRSPSPSPSIELPSGSSDVNPPNPPDGGSVCGVPKPVARETRISDDFTVTPEMREWADKTVPGLDLEWATEEFIDHWRARPFVKASMKTDWVATWRNRMRDLYQNVPRTPGRSLAIANGRASPDPPLNKRQLQEQQIVHKREERLRREANGHAN